MLELNEKEKKAKMIIHRITSYNVCYTKLLRMSARQAGTILIIQPIVQTLLSPFCGRLADRYPAARVATAGMTLCVLGLGVAATLGAAAPLPQVVAVLALLGTGFALFSSPNTSVIV